MRFSFFCAEYIVWLIFVLKWVVLEWHLILERSPVPCSPCTTLIDGDFVLYRAKWMTHLLVRWTTLLVSFMLVPYEKWPCTSTCRFQLLNPLWSSPTGVLPDKKFEADKRGVNLGDYNDMMRKERSGFRLPNSKEMGAADSGPYFEKVSIYLCSQVRRPPQQNKSLPFSVIRSPL